jgi:hypothetical protein
MVPVTSTIYMVTILPIKIAILLEWVRIFAPKGSHNMVFWTSHILIWANVCFYLAIIIALNSACSPYEYNWDKLISGICDRVDTTKTNLSASVFNLISDLMILLIPQRTIWKLQMAKRRKYGVSVIFAVGLLGCGAALARLVETVYHATSVDFTYTFSAVQLCSGAELTCGFLVICIPSFPKAFRAVDIGKVKQTLSFWTWGSSQRALRSNSKRNTEGTPAHSRSSPFSKLKPTKNSDVEIESHQLHPVPKLNHKVSKQQSVDSYDNLGNVEQGIVRTTFFEATESYQEHPEPSGDSHKLQQQWR